VSSQITGHMHKLLEANNLYMQLVQQVATRAFNELVLPFCQQHGLLFLNGDMNHYFCGSADSGEPWDGGTFDQHEGGYDIYTLLEYRISIDGGQTGRPFGTFMPERATLDDVSEEATAATS
jgi:hypothetical protein